MEAQGPLFRRGVPTLQTSLTLPELPCTATAILVCENVSRSLVAVAVQGSFLSVWEVGFCHVVRLRAFGTMGLWREYAFRKCRLIPPHQSLSRQTACSFLPTRGEAIYTLCEHGKQLCKHSKQKCEQNKQNFEKPIELQEQTGL